MFATIKNFLKKDFKKSIKSPTIIVACLIVGTIVYFLVRWRYDGLIESQKSRIELKDDLIGEYRERLGLLPSGGNKYSILTHDELKEEALDIAEKIRNLNLEYNNKKSNLDNAENDQMLSAESNEKRKEVWDRFRKLSIQLSFEYDMKFEKLFGSDLILIRDEILTRIPDKKKEGLPITSWKKYGWLIKSGFMEEIVMELEVLAKNLNP